MAFLKEKLELQLEEAELRTASALSRYPKPLKIAAFLLLIGLIPSFYVAKFLGRTLESQKLEPQALVAKPSFSSYEPLQIKQVLLVKNENGTYSAAAQVLNPNLELALNNETATFTFLNPQQEAVQTSPIKFFILPGQTKWLVVPRVSSTESLVRAEVTFSDALAWQKRANIPSPKLIASPPAISSQTQPVNLAVKGSITNTSNYLIKEVTVYFLLYDANNTITSISLRSINDLRPAERRDYVQLWPGLSGQGFRVEVSTDTNVLDPKNIQAPDTLPGGSLDR